MEGGLFELVARGKITVALQCVGGGSWRLELIGRGWGERGWGRGEEENSRDERRVACSASAPGATSHRFLREELTKWPPAAFPFLPRALFRVYGAGFRLSRSLCLRCMRMWTEVWGNRCTLGDTRPAAQPRRVTNVEGIELLTGPEGAAWSFYTKMQNEYRYVLHLLTLHIFSILLSDYVSKPN